MNNKEGSQDPYKLLEQYFGHGNFRGLQRSIINRVLEERAHALVLMPTGAGKSICYQIPALALPGKTLVISPLIALMQDQVEGLRSRGIDAHFINSTVSRIDRDKRMEAFLYGSTKLLYVTPERFTKADFVQQIRRATISLLAVDEAHCISSWGHDFRPQYARIGEFRKLLGDPVTIALTATATKEVQTDIIEKLGLTKAEIKIFHQGIARPNLRLEALEVHDNDQKLTQIIDCLKNHQGSGIIYFALIKTLEEFSRLLDQQGILHLRYHGKLDAKERKIIQREFMNFQVPVLATNSFGMGIDKADIRYVIHAEIPGSIESYYQEIGRAGRDGKPSQCLLLYNQDDLTIHMDFINWSNPEPNFYKKLHALLIDHEQKVNALGLEYIREQLVYKNRFDFRLETALSLMERYDCLSGSLDSKNLKLIKALPNELIDQSLHDEKILRDRKKLLSMVNYVKSEECRRIALEHYFGFDDTDECHNCDVCLD